MSSFSTIAQILVTTFSSFGWVFFFSYVYFEMYAYITTYSFKIRGLGSSLAVQWLRYPACTAGVAGCCRAAKKKRKKSINDFGVKKFFRSASQDPSGQRRRQHSVSWTLRGQWHSSAHSCFRALPGQGWSQSVRPCPGFQPVFWSQ